MATTTDLPAKMRAIVLPAKGQPATLQEVPTPQPGPGSAIVKVLAADISAATPFLLSSQSPFTMPEPCIPGTRSVGRVAAVGPDATAVKVGQLVFVEYFLRARDDTDVQALFGLFDGASPTSKKWIADNWRNGAYAEYLSAPLENIIPVNEDLLINKFGHSFADLLWLPTALVPYGGFKGINLQPGETVIVAPATGAFSGSAIAVAVAMGATVIAASRNLTALQKLQSHYPDGRVHVVQLTGDVSTDTTNLTSFGPVDAFLDISPAQAEGTTHVHSGIKAVRWGGRVSLMGVLQQDVPVPYVDAVFRNLTIRGQYMYERADARGFMQLVDAGLLKIGKDIGAEVVGEFGLDRFQDAIECAQKNSAYGQVTSLKP